MVCWCMPFVFYFQWSVDSWVEALCSRGSNSSCWNKAWLASLSYRFLPHVISNLFVEWSKCKLVLEVFARKCSPSCQWLPTHSFWSSPKEYFRNLAYGHTEGQFMDKDCLSFCLKFKHTQVYPLVSVLRDSKLSSRISFCYQFFVQLCFCNWVLGYVSQIRIIRFLEINSFLVLAYSCNILLFLAR